MSNDVEAEALSALGQAHRQAAAGNPEDCLRTLRQVPDGLPMGDRTTFLEIVGLVGGCARQIGSEGLTRAADALRVGPDDPRLLYDYGFSCVEFGAPWLAVPALALAVAHAPTSVPIRMELVAALEAEARHDEAVSVLATEPVLDRWIGRYLLVFNCLMSGDVEGARQWYSRLGEPEEGQHAAMADRLTGMLARVQALTGSSRPDGTAPSADPLGPLGEQDLRGWHFALNAGVLATLSPFGFAEGMSGRYAFLNETVAGCRHGLHRLSLVLETAGWRPRSVALLADRSSRLLGLAAARLLDLPARDWTEDTGDALVVAYTLTGADNALVSGLRRAPGQLLFEHATCWTETPAVAADVSTLLAQVVSTPWEAHRRPVPGGGGWVDVPADGRPDAELVTELLAAPAEPRPGDGNTPDDSDAALTGFVTRVAPLFATGARPRDRVRSPGPVRSPRFW